MYSTKLLYFVFLLVFQTVSSYQDNFRNKYIISIVRRHNNHNKHHKKLRHEEKKRTIVESNKLPPLAILDDTEDASKPGHSLLYPKGKMLKSSASYPLRDVGGSLVYGNMENVGMTLGKSSNRLRYTNFRRFSPSGLLNKVFMSSMVKPPRRGGDESLGHKQEIYDALFRRSGSSNIYYFPQDFRRKKKKTIYRDRSNFYTSSSSESSSAESDYDKNPGNPYTLYKGKYKQNWIWNHKMDGDHMNINPYAPDMKPMGVPGGDLFFARKWWYFNQDDFKPLG